MDLRTRHFNDESGHDKKDSLDHILWDDYSYRYNCQRELADPNATPLRDNEHLDWL